VTDQPSRTPDVARASGDELLAAADLADRVDEYGQEAHRRLNRALAASVLGPGALGLLLLLNRGEVTWSAVLFLVALLLVGLVPVWGNWWLFVATELADAREAASKNRILGGEDASTGNDLQAR